MPLDNIAARLTPSVPMSLAFGAQPIATGTKIVTLIGHLPLTGASLAAYTPYSVVNVGSAAAAAAELAPILGAGSEIYKMALAFINANQAVPTGSTGQSPQFRVVGLLSTDAAFGASLAAFTAINRLRSDAVVSPYDFTSGTLLTDLLTFALSISGVDSDLKGQFGTIGVAASIAAAATQQAVDPDTAYLDLVGMPDSAGTPSQVVGVIAAAYAGMVYGSQQPYLPLDGQVLGGLIAPTVVADIIDNNPEGASEVFLTHAIAPLTVNPAGNVAIIRCRNARLSVGGDGLVPATAYLDRQDIMPLFDYREALFDIAETTPFKNSKATTQQALLFADQALNECYTFQALGMFENVASGQVMAAVSASSEGRIDFQSLVDVSPGLHVIAGNIIATFLGA